jgi:hypothetical protein
MSTTRGDFAVPNLDADLWDRLFSNERLGRTCKAGDEKKLAPGMPTINVLDTWPVCERIPEARLGHAEFAERLVSMGNTGRMEFIERVINVHVAAHPGLGKTVYLTVPTED